MEKPIEFSRFGVMIDVSRNAVMTVRALKRMIDLSKSLGLNTLYLYMEDTFEVKSHPLFGAFRGRYSERELCEIDDYGFENGVEIVPCVQTLAHMGTLLRWEEYKNHRDIDDILLVGDEFVYRLIDDIFGVLTRCFRTRKINIGMDEAHNMGRGKHMDKNGAADRVTLFLSHLGRVSKIAENHGLTVGIWSDMFFRLASGGEYSVPDAGMDPTVGKLIPENVELIYWDYYSTDKKHYDDMLGAHEKLKPGCWFAGGLWSWMGPVPHNAYSITATGCALSSAREHGVRDVMLTMWGDNGGECSRFSLLPSLFYASQVAKGETDMGKIKELFTKRFGISFDDFMLLDLPGTPEYSATSVVNPDKYMLYSDPFAGLFDGTVCGGEGKTFAAVSEKLSRVSAGEYVPLFASAKALCDVLEIKYELGFNTRKAYQNGDRVALEKLLPCYGELLLRLETYYRAFKTVWESENKPFGFEVQDVRLGGLMRRVYSCKERLENYLAGKIPSIEELDAPVINPFSSTKPLHYNSWSGTVTANNIG